MCKLQILTDAASLKHTDGFNVEDDFLLSSGSDPNSLFDEMDGSEDMILDEGSLASSSTSYTEPAQPLNEPPARRRAPSIPGLYFDPDVVLPDELAEGLLQKCLDTYFRSKDVNQVMLFERLVPPTSISPASSQGGKPLKHVS